MGRRRPLVGVAALGIPAVNALAHIGPALRARAYNPGLATAVMLFVPMCIWIFRALLRAKVRDRAQVAIAMLAGALLHGVLLGSPFAFSHGLISEPVLVATQLANGLLPLGIATLVPARRPCVAPT